MIKSSDYIVRRPYRPEVLSSKAWRDDYAKQLADLPRRRAEANERFKRDLFAEFGLTGHPKAERAYRVAERYADSFEFLTYDWKLKAIYEALKVLANLLLND